MISADNEQLIKKFVDEHCITAEDFGKILKIHYLMYEHRCAMKAANDAAMRAAKAFDGLREAFLIHDITLISKRRDYQTE